MNEGRKEEIINIYILGSAHSTRTALTALPSYTTVLSRTYFSTST